MVPLVLKFGKIKTLSLKFINDCDPLLIYMFAHSNMWLSSNRHELDEEHNSL